MFNIGSLSSAANQLDVLEVQSVSNEMAPPESPDLPENRHISSGANGWENMTSTQNAVINTEKDYEITSSSAYTWGNSAINYHTKSSVYSTKIIMVVG
ncbi:hypothetical protein [Bacillus cereus]|uniref:Uncharacterized protein n=1 Tax=Bacillus cereus VD184 TaxID=1053242 RepID=A0A9W5R0P1_BACCE|nr:hypothetical protein [Bacillus cereus]EOQ01562.1 hypothetical protein IKC_06481 [Bacillus cereus VD184]